MFKVLYLTDEENNSLETQLNAKILEGWKTKQVVFRHFDSWGAKFIVVLEKPLDMECRVIGRDTLLTLQAEIEELSGSGWQPQGGGFVFDGQVCQTLVRVRQ